MKDFNPIRKIAVLLLIAVLLATTLPLCVFWGQAQAAQVMPHHVDNSMGAIHESPLPGWDYSDTITIVENSGSDLTNYQVQVELNASNFDFAQANSDGSDLRFSTGSTSSSLPTSGLVTYYPFDGNADDESGNGNHGIVHNSPEWVDAQIGQAVSFDDNAGYIEIADNSDFHLNTFTWEIRGIFNYHNDWWKNAIDYDGPWADYDGIQFTTVPWEHEDVPMRKKFCFSIARDDDDIVGNDSGYHNEALYSTTLAEDGEAFHVAVTRDDSGLSKMYVNGVLEDQKEILHNPRWNHGYPMWIGRGGGFDDAYQYNDNVMDEFRIYNRALSEAEIQSLYNGNSTTEDLGYWIEEWDSAAETAKEPLIKAFESSFEACDCRKNTSNAHLL